MAVVIDTSKLERALKALKTGPARNGERVMRQFALHMVKAMRERLPATQRSLKRSIVGVSSANEARIGSPLPWARLAHFGGRVVASGNPAYKDPAAPLRSRRGSVSEVTGKPIKYLAIPIGDLAKSRTGRLSRPRDYPNTYVFKSRSGKLFIAQRTVSGRSIQDYSEKRRTGGYFMGRAGWSQTRAKKDQKSRLLFVLKKAIQYPAQPYAFVGPEDRAALAEIVAHVMRKSLE